MSATTNRRGILGLFAAAPIAAAANGSPSNVLGRTRTIALSVRGLDRASAAVRHAAAQARELAIPGISAAIERAHPLEAKIPADHAELIARLDAEPSIECLGSAEARAIAALAVVFPPEIAAYRSFAPHLRRRLYAELLMRKVRRAATGGPPPPPPQPGSGA